MDDPVILFDGLSLYKRKDEMKKSMLSGWSSIPGGILFFGDYVYMYTRVHALSRSIVC